jgi:hypothetical protein
MRCRADGQGARFHIRRHEFAMRNMNALRRSKIHQMRKRDSTMRSDAAKSLIFIYSDFCLL